MGVRVLKESWCFCNGGGKSERTKGAIFTTKSCSVATVSSSGAVSGTGFLIHRNLLLTTHGILPSVAAAETAEIRLHCGVGACLFPNRFFITSSVLDLTIVGLDAMDGESNMQVQQPNYLKTCSKPNLDLGSIVYLLGYTEKSELTVGEGKIVIATDNLIKLSTDGISYKPGSVGFDVHGNLSFMICDPMKLATSPNTKSSSTSSSSTSSWKKDLLMQFGIPIPIIYDWLNQHWEGSLDELNKPKLPLIRLMSSGPKSEHSCASFTKRRVFKSMEEENDTSSPSTSNIITKSCQDETIVADHGAATRVQGIPTPEIYESSKLTSVPFKKKESSPIQLLDINFPPRTVKATVAAQPAKKKELHLQHEVREQETSSNERNPSPVAHAEIASPGSVNGAQSEVRSCSSPIEGQDECSSEGETTMYSAETAESRNYTSPREGKFQPVGRSQSCVNYSRWGPVQKNPAARRAMLEKQRSFMQGSNVYSQGATSQRSNDFLSPTVSSIMKKRNNLEQTCRPRPSHSPPKRNNIEQTTRSRPSAIYSPPKWMF